MARFLLTTFFYFAAIVLFYAATTLAPHMAWPESSQDWIACDFLLIGFACKMLGHIGLLTRAFG